MGSLAESQSVGPGSQGLWPSASRFRGTRESLSPSLSPRWGIHLAWGSGEGDSRRHRSVWFSEAGWKGCSSRWSLTEQAPVSG